ncbi:MAG: hypothetical protein HY778_18165 [Betaproteobacteria bacterium]|nr:hypothetical protein [Betaproteobacteria bacterium]
MRREWDDVGRDAGFGIPAHDAKLQDWRNAMFNLKSVLDRCGVPFPGIPEVGITGEEIVDVVDMADIIPVF